MRISDWSSDVCSSDLSAPGKRLELLDKAVRKSLRLSNYLHAASFQADAPLCIEPLPGDYRFKGEAWDKQPYAFYAQAFLLNQHWWHNVTRGVPGRSEEHPSELQSLMRTSYAVFGLKKQYI